MADDGFERKQATSNYSVIRQLSTVIPLSLTF